MIDQRRNLEGVETAEIHGVQNALVVAEMTSRGLLAKAERLERTLRETAEGRAVVLPLRQTARRF